MRDHHREWRRFDPPRKKARHLADELHDDVVLLLVQLADLPQRPPVEQVLVRSAYTAYAFDCFLGCGTWKSRAKQIHLMSPGNPATARLYHQFLQPAGARMMKVPMVDEEDAQ